MGDQFEASYLKLLRNGELDRRVEEGNQLLNQCRLCGWECRVNRNEGAMGICHTGVQASLANFGPHLGEENPLRGWRGSGTIFFARCNLRCQYCQNFDISQTDNGDQVRPETLAAVMLRLQDYDCHNINLVSPSHVVVQILSALAIAARNGLKLPIVYNTGGYDSLVALRLLDGVIDIYMPDMKYASQSIAREYSKIPKYPQINQSAVKEMHRQVGDLQIDEHGLANRGLLVRHLVLPNDLAGTAEILRFIAREISPNTYINLMDQFHPAYNVKAHPDRFAKINRPITGQEYQAAVQLAHAAGLTRLD